MLFWISILFSFSAHLCKLHIGVPMQHFLSVCYKSSDYVNFSGIKIWVNPRGFFPPKFIFIPELTCPMWQCGFSVKVKLYFRELGYRCIDRPWQNHETFYGVFSLWSRTWLYSREHQLVWMFNVLSCLLHHVTFTVWHVQTIMCERNISHNCVTFHGESSIYTLMSLYKLPSQNINVSWIQCRFFFPSYNQLLFYDVCIVIWRAWWIYCKCRVWRKTGSAVQTIFQA